MTLLNAKSFQTQLTRGFSFLNQMFKMSPFRATDSCSVSNVLIKATPLFNQSFFQVIDVADLVTVESLPQNPPNCLVHQTEIRAVPWPLQWTDEVRSSADSSVTVSLAPRWAGALSCWKVKKSQEIE